MKKKFFLSFLFCLMLIIFSSCSTEKVENRELVPNNPKESLINSTGSKSTIKYLTGGSIQGETKMYTNKRFNFSVEFPKVWTYKVDEDEIIPNKLVSPDSGINIFIESNEEDRIYVYGMVGPLALPDEYSYQKNYFKTNSGVVGDLLSREIEGRKEICLIINTEKYYYGANINVSLKSFEKNESQVMAVLGSIKLADYK